MMGVSAVSKWALKNEKKPRGVFFHFCIYNTNGDLVQVVDGVVGVGVGV